MGYWIKTGCSGQSIIIEHYAANSAVFLQIIFPLTIVAFI